MGKVIEIKELFNDTLKEITKDENTWISFLKTASWNFKYNFSDQILIYAQRPNATACATMEEWNKKVKRWVNKGANCIFVFSKDEKSKYPFRFIFDVLDTHNYNNTPYKLWNVKKEYENKIIESLETKFGEIEKDSDLIQAIFLTSQNIISDNMQDYLSSIIRHKEGTMLQDLSDNEISALTYQIAFNSISYMILNRCGKNAEEYIAKSEISCINKFNNNNLIIILGTAISDMAEIGLREIARTVVNLGKEENKNHTFAKNNKQEYNNNKENDKGGIENEGNRIYQNGRLQYTKSSNGERENSSREIRSNEIQLSNEPQKIRVDNSSNEPEINRTFNTDTNGSKSESGRISRTNETTRRDNGGIESQRPIEVGRIDEQLPNDSRGNSSERNDKHLEETKSKRVVLSKEEQEITVDYLQDKYVSALLSNVENLNVTRNEIKEFYKTHSSLEERTECIKQAFNDAYTEIVVNDTRLGYKTYENVLHLWKDNYLNRTAEVYYSWESVTEYIEGLILVNEFNDLHKQVPNYDDQMQILQVEAENAPTFSFSQEIIDYALQEGGNIQESKMRIYHQFEQSLSSQENIKFLKDEYGWGGSSSIHIGTGVGIDFNGKGIKLYRGYGENAPEILLPWNKVEKRISELIKLDRYLNPKEKEEYSNWLKKQDQEIELRKAEQRLENQADQQEYDLAKRVYSFVKPFDLYNYTDDSRALNTDEENIEIVKADINDERNVIDYVNALKETIKNIEDTNPQKQEIEALLIILEKRVPHYEYHLGDKVYIGSDEYEIAGIKDNIVTLYNPKFPIFNEQMNIDEFERKVKDNYVNDHLKVENIKENNIQEKQQTLEEPYKQDTEKELEDKTYKVGQEVYLESDRKYRINKIDLEHEKIELQDLSINYPIFREESILTFENLYNQNERNFNKEEIKPNFIKTSNKIQDFILHPEVPIEDRNNYRITDNNLGVGTPREKFERNIEAIKVLKRCEEENRYATPEEQEVLAQYVGWGGLQQAFDENNASWSEEYKTLKELLNDEEYKNARSSVLTAFYTPPIVINSMYEILQNMGLKEANILEPSCGIGNFFGMLPTELERCKMYGVELDSISGRIAGQLYQKSTIAVNAFEKVELPDSFFDVAVR